MPWTVVWDSGVHFSGSLLSNSIVRFLSILRTGPVRDDLPVTWEDENMALEHTDVRKPRPREGRVRVRVGLSAEV